VRHEIVCRSERLCLSSRSSARCSLRRRTRARSPAAPTRPATDRDGPTAPVSRLPSPGHRRAVFQCRRRCTGREAERRDPHSAASRPRYRRKTHRRWARRPTVVPAAHEDVRRHFTGRPGSRTQRAPPARWRGRPRHRREAARVRQASDAVGAAQISFTSSAPGKKRRGAVDTPSSSHSGDTALTHVLTRMRHLLSLSSGLSESSAETLRSLMITRSFRGSLGRRGQP